MRQSGILLPLSSLASDYGIGELGKEAVEFVDIMKEAGVSIWQLLPLNPLGYGNSPYQPYSSYAGDEIYISLSLLVEEGLLKEAPAPFRKNAGSVDYEAVRSYKEPYLREAFRAFAGGSEYERFTEKEKRWLDGYAAFRALRRKNGDKSWPDWPEEDKWQPERQGELDGGTLEEVRYHKFLQYEFYRQWMQIKRYANENGIQVMGDIPFYVGLDSADVWTGKRNFLLDDDGRPTYIAGVPPDYFSETGQRWGNPIYDWETMKREGYQFWLDRIGYNSSLFDIIRIDHFRAFDTFWKIPASCPTAVEGEWIEAPGYEVLDRIMEKLPGVHLVAEDLGDLRPEVMTLKEHYGLKGMKIVEFSFNTAGRYAFDEAPGGENLIVYTGTHDNATAKEWYDSLSAAARRKLRRFLRKRGYCGSIVEQLIRYTLDHKAEFAVIPMPDILELGSYARLNTPGTVGSPNWEWKLVDFEGVKKQMEKYAKYLRRDE